MVMSVIEIMRVVVDFSNDTKNPSNSYSKPRQQYQKTLSVVISIAMMRAFKCRARKKRIKCKQPSRQSYRVSSAANVQSVSKFLKAL